MGLGPCPRSASRVRPVDAWGIGGAGGVVLGCSAVSVSQRPPPRSTDPVTSEGRGEG